MARKATRQQERDEEEPSQDQQDQIQQPEIDEDDFLNEPEFEEHAEENRNKQLLEAIAEIVVNSPTDPIRLTYQALYCLKRKEMDLNQQMVTEIEKLKDKYELMKQPLYSEISHAVLGKGSHKELSCPTSSSRKSKVTSSNIPEFWMVVFAKAGLLNDEIEVDMDCFQNLSAFTCDHLEENFNQVRISFTFKRAPKYFKNQQLEILIEMGSEDDETTCKVAEPIEYRLPKVEGSLFTQLFDNENLREVGILATEINQSYRNALYFYFSKYHEGSSTSQAGDDSAPFPHELSSKKVKSESNSAEKTVSPEKPERK